MTDLGTGRAGQRTRTRENTHIPVWLPLLAVTQFDARRIWGHGDLISDKAWIFLDDAGFHESLPSICQSMELTSFDNRFIYYSLTSV